MTEASMSRMELKAACLALLDQEGIEHPAGHQGRLVARYILYSASSERIGLMFEKGEKAQSHLWIEQRFTHILEDLNIPNRIYPASALYREVEPSGKRIYGRHAALKPMRDLGNADLVRFTIDRISQLWLILERLAEPH